MESSTTSAPRHSGSTSPLPSKGFPYLDLSGLTHEQQQELRKKLQFESEQIKQRFQELVSDITKSFEKRCVPLDDLVTHVMSLGAFEPPINVPQVPVFRDYFEKLKVAKTIPEVFMVLDDCFSFFNYDIIEHIVEGLGTEEDKARLQRYKQEFRQYAERRIFECPPEYGPESDDTEYDEYTTLSVKLDANYDDCTVAELERFRHRLSHILHLSPKSVLRLCRVEKGCIQLTFQVPTFIQIFPLSSRQERNLAAEGVIRLQRYRRDGDSGGTLQIGTDGGKFLHLAISVKANT